MAMHKDDRVNLTPAQQMDQSDVRNGRRLDASKGSNQERQQLQEQSGKQNNETQEEGFQSKRSQVQYQLKQVIGKGSYGVVYKAINKKTSQIVAIKEVNYENDDELRDVMSEVDLLKNLNHINIVKYHGFIQKSHNLYLILEYCSHGSLKNLISRGNGLDEKRAKAYVRQTLNGLHYLHEQGVIHRDIKAANLLLDSNNVVKLADFGVSTQVNTIMMAMTLAGSLNWMAPEIITNRGATTLSDIWSLGATVLELLTGNPPFHNLVDLNIYYAIENDSFIPPNFLSPLAQDFLLSCFQKNMYKRPTALQLLKHKWLVNNNDIGKLEQFQEINNNNTWDQDFKETDIIGRNKDLKSTINEKTNNETVRVNSTGSSGTSIKKADDEFLSKIVIDKTINHAQLTILFDDLPSQCLASMLIKLLQKNSINDVLIKPIFEYDENFNGTKLKQWFIKLGGVPLILNKSSIIEHFFIKDSYKILFQSGVMLNQNLSKIDDPIKFELVLKYFEISNSSKFWCDWCSENLDIKELLRKDNLSNKSIQTIILKLSFFSDISLWFPQQFIGNLLKIEPLKENFDKQSLSIVFKSLSAILIQSHKRAFSSQIIPSSSSSSLSLSTPPSSPSPSPSRSPTSIRSSSIKPNLFHSNSNIEGPITAFNLPSNFFPWLLAFLNDSNFYQMTDFHAWKYYVIVLYHTIHLNKMLTKTLTTNHKFLSLVLVFLNYRSTGICYQHQECLSVVIHQSLAIIVEMSNDVKVFNMLYFELSLKFLNFDEDCIAGGIEVLFNCLQLALHDDNKFCIEDAENLSLHFQESKDKMVTLHYYHLVDAFCNIREDDIQFGNFISKLIKICSLAPLGFISFKLLFHPKFFDRCIRFFQLYRNSLLIQIDLLKFIKLVFSRSFEFNIKSLGAEMETFKHIQVKLAAIVEFLSNNWKKHEIGQVGFDSILIRQLCNDIKDFGSKLPVPISNSWKSSENDGFLIPKLPPPSSSEL